MAKKGKKVGGGVFIAWVLLTGGVVGKKKWFASQTVGSTGLILV